MHDVLSEITLTINVVTNQELFNCTTDCLFLVFFVFEVADKLMEGHVIQNGKAGCIFYDLGGIMKSKKQ